jgi:hypothetical protein
MRGNRIGKERPTWRFRVRFQADVVFAPAGIAKRPNRAQISDKALLRLCWLSGHRRRGASQKENGR